ncbi:glycoside hydrolase family 18 protein [Lophiostoma macrostomum CBS 122681]|uniref:chitinase n=1 Tax=Lophiostoma macrostomum CBS 122681 TaxID=1314788 RepID=A0A6A6TQH6_9PLEO|nr:glycoside hydrolase family 18 protein [Lophiostoma macrostomum CBS 122681]
MGCSFKPRQSGALGSCTNTVGVLSNREIKRILTQEGITPYFNETAMVKYFTYQGDSWVGYDDAETYALKEAFTNSFCLGGTMIWSIDFDDATGAGLGDPNGYISPESATVIPMAHTTVPAGETFTIDPGASTDIPRLPFGGDQNRPRGPGADRCEQCSFFRLITSTCCGTGGSIGNPILIPAGIPTPMDIPLPPGFVPPQSFTDPDGHIIPAGQPLPKETIIPGGTVFSHPFLIGPGVPFHEGEGEDRNSNSSHWVWLSPEIWKSPNPQVQCYFPCVLFLPPYTSFTTTVDYPRITVTESGTTKTTLTFPPLTVSSWAPTTIVVGGRYSCTTSNSASCTDTGNNRRTSSVQISQSTTWPGNPDDPDHSHCLWPFYPPPPPHIPLPRLTIRNGPPKPTTNECAWPTLTCTPGPTTRTVSGTVPSEPPKTSTTSTTSITKTPVIPTTSAIPTPTAKSPNFDNDQIKCYNSGQWTKRARMVNAADSFCDGVQENYQHLSAGMSLNATQTFSLCCGEVTGVKLYTYLLIKDGCEWAVSNSTCKTEMRKMIDQCDEDGENRKQGGTIEGDCIVDPNSDL